MMMRAVSLLLVAASVPAAEWKRISSSRFEILTDAGESHGRDVLTRLETVRRVLPQARQWDSQPVRVYVFRSPAAFRRVRPSAIARGFYQSGPDRDYIAMEAAGGETLRVVCHEYVHLVLQHTSAVLPRWLEEGLAEFYSTLELAGGQARVGRAVPAHVRLLRETAWLDATVLAGVSRDSAYYHEPGKAGIFYAQSWALVHMLNLAPYWRERLPRYAELLAEAVPAQAAFEQAFARTLTQALAAARTWVSSPRIPTIAMAAEAESPPAEVASLTAPEARAAMAELLLAVGNHAEAEREYRDLAHQFPASPEAQTGLGTLALARGDHAAARDHLKRALDWGASEARTFFEYAMLLRDTGAPRTEVAAWLARTVALSPSFAEAHFLLGTMAAAAGRDEEAVEHLRRATAILPRQSYFWHALALAWHRIGNRELARRAASRAADAASTEHEAEMARAALRLVDTTAASPAAKKPATTVPDTWSNPRGDASIDGALVLVECQGTVARFHIAGAGKTVVLTATRPGDILIRTAGAVPGSQRAEFACGPQQRIPVRVEYLAATGEMVALEWR